MKIGILGTGVVGNTLGTKLTQQGHQVMMGSRSSNNEKAAKWVKTAGKNASQGTFADAARFGEVIFNCTSGMASLDALKVSGRENLAGKILIDVANALDFSKGMPPTLAVSNTDSLAEQIQRAYPDVKVVKALNTMNCYLMVNPKSVPGDHNVFMSGNDAGAKAQVATMLTDWFGWKGGQHHRSWRRHNGAGRRDAAPHLASPHGDHAAYEFQLSHCRRPKTAKVALWAEHVPG